MSRRTTRIVLSAASLAIAAAACGGGSSGGGAPASSGTALVGTFHITAGRCTGSGAPTGSYFRMIDANGTLANGPYFENPDSVCKDKSYSVEIPGTDGGLVTGTFQPPPAKAFDAQGNSLADRILETGTFTAIQFGIQTESTDPQSHTTVPAPQIFDDNGKLTGQLEAWSASWNNQYFNQGSPKPGGAMPGITSPVTGTYDASTGAFTLSWTSSIVGGPFNSFSGYWHLQGHFTPSS
ncbi:MAG TPA: hypothetical protein VHW74_09925 [Mycobacteriales bacterium]|jgi:hypothetical protein|nr:hypothetical protein [Mycobacteriales bacterium]